MEYTHTVNAEVELIAILRRMKLGHAIQHYMHQQGLTQQQLAARINLEQASISRILNDRQTPSLATLEAIASALRVRLSELILRAEEGDGDEARWRALYRILPPEQRQAALDLLEPKAKYRRKI